MAVTINEIKRIISLQLGLTTVGDLDHLLENLGAESADIMNIVATVEEIFHVEIKESEIPDLLTPLALFHLVRDRM